MYNNAGFSATGTSGRQFPPLGAGAIAGHTDGGPFQFDEVEVGGLHGILITLGDAARDDPANPENFFS